MKNKKILRLILGLLSFVLIVFIGQQVSAQNNIPNINGQWTYRSVGVFASDGTTCSIFNARPIPDSTVTITQSNTSFSSSGGISYYPGRSAENRAIGEGTITGNQIQSRHQTIDQLRPVYTVSWSGNISADTNTISGNITCTKTDGRPGEGSLRFTLTRGSQPSSNQTPSNSQAPPFPLDAGPNTIRPDFR